jgi:hypothetical protein
MYHYLKLSYNNIYINFKLINSLEIKIYLKNNKKISRFKKLYYYRKIFKNFQLINK